jgi:hypothetical protein
VNFYIYSSIHLGLIGAILFVKLMRLLNYAQNMLKQIKLILSMRLNLFFVKMTKIHDIKNFTLGHL